MSCWLDNQEAWLSQAMWIVLGRSTDLSQLDATGSCLIKSPGYISNHGEYNPGKITLVTWGTHGVVETQSH